MSTLDEITKAKQRVSEALARVDAQREKLTGQLEELEATERVLARYSKGRQTKKAVSARTQTTTAERDEVASRRHSMTSSERARIDGGTVRPSASAVLRLITSSNLVGCWTGRSAGFSPLSL